VWICYATAHALWIHPPNITSVFTHLPGSTVTLERTFLAWGMRLLPVLWAVYIPLYFTALPLALIYALFRKDDVFEEIIAAVLVTYAISFLIYALFVVQPPHEVLGTNPVGINVSDLGNPRFVFPSLHVGISTLLAMIFWRRRTKLRYYFATLAILMPVAVVLLLQHWIWDVLAGWLVGIAGARYGRMLAKHVRRFEEKITPVCATIIITAALICLAIRI